MYTHLKFPNRYVLTIRWLEEILVQLRICLEFRAWRSQTWNVWSVVISIGVECILESIFAGWPSVACFTKPTYWKRSLELWRFGFAKRILAKKVTIRAVPLSFQIFSHPGFVWYGTKGYRTAFFLGNEHRGEGWVQTCYWSWVIGLNYAKIWRDTFCSLDKVR